MTRNDKLKPNSDAACEQNRQITKKCKPKANKSTKGKGKNSYRFVFFYFLLFCNICVENVCFQIK